MVALKHERRVFMWHVSPQTIPMDVPKDVTLDEILEKLETAFRSKAARLYLGPDGGAFKSEGGSKPDPKNCVYIADIKRIEKPDAIVLLINRGDPDAANPAFIDAVSNDVSVVPPKPNETQGWSAHLCISLTQDGSAYRACFERMQNVSSTLVEKLFQELLDTSTKSDPLYTYEKRVKIPSRKGRPPKEKIEIKPYRIKLRIKRVPSEQIIEDIEKGELTHVSLIRRNVKYEGPGAPNIIQSATNTLTLRARAADKGAVATFVEEVTSWARKHDFNEIQFKIVELPGSASAQPRFTLEKEDALETLYVRSQKLDGFGLSLERCYSQTCEEITKKLVELLSDSEKW